MKEFVKKLINELEKSKKVLEGEATKEMMVNGHTLDFENLNGGVGAVKCIITLVKHLAEEHEKKNPTCYFIKENEKLKQRLNSIYGKNGNGIIYADTDCIYEINRWIPCSDRMPEKYGEYLCCDTYGNFVIGFPSESNTSNTGFVVETEHEYCYDIIAWMPLPAPYKEV